MRGWGDRVIEASIKKLIIKIAWGIHPSFRLARRAVALAQRAGLWRTGSTSAYAKASAGRQSSKQDG